MHHRSHLDEWREMAAFGALNGSVAAAAAAAALRAAHKAATTPSDGSSPPPTLHSSTGPNTTGPSSTLSLPPSAFGLSAMSLPLSLQSGGVTPSATAALFGPAAAFKFAGGSGGGGSAGSMYTSPPPVSSNPENNTCRMIEYRGHKLAAFKVDGRELICLPQAFELFLRNLVGGLHTVYTKLKRLGITPIVCNVEQVRVLRGFGAIQPGVNRCKLISPKEFDVLYDDCTSSSARPGRPPKRSSTPNLLSSDPLKKSRMDSVSYGYYSDYAKSSLLGGSFGYAPHLAQFPFLSIPHPAAAMMNYAAMAHHPYAAIKPANMPQHSATSDTADNRYATDLSVKKPGTDGRADSRALDNVCSPSPPPAQRPGSCGPLNGSTGRRQLACDADWGSSCESGANSDNGSVDHDVDDYDSDDDRHPTSRDSLPRNGDIITSRRPTDDEHADDKLQSGYVGEHSARSPSSVSRDEDREREAGEVTATSQQQQQTVAGLAAQRFPQLAAEAAAAAARVPCLSSLESLLINIQGILKVAVEAARYREQQLDRERDELRMRDIREKDIIESLERQLADEKKHKVALRKKIDKLRSSERRLRHQLVASHPTGSRTELDSAKRPSVIKDEQTGLLRDHNASPAPLTSRAETVMAS